MRLQHEREVLTLKGHFNPKSDRGFAICTAFSSNVAMSVMELDGKKVAQLLDIIYASRRNCFLYVSPHRTMQASTDGFLGRTAARVTQESSMNQSMSRSSV